MPASSFDLRALGRRVGIDGAVAYTLAQRSFSVLAAPLTLALIATRLSPAEQGYYYTFASVLGVQQLFELGLSYVLLQFASHEKAKLEWTKEGILVGDDVAKGRLASLLRVVLLWYAIIAVAAVVVLLPGGRYFFRNAPSGASSSQWEWPWVWVVFASALALFLGPVFSVIEGCGQVAQVARQRILQTVLGNIALWAALLAHAGLFAAPVLTTVIALAGVGWLLGAKRRFLIDLLRTRHPTARVSWGGEVWPFQWRIAVSTLSGYFIYQIANPILFATHGAEAAGRLGMSATIMGAIAGTALSWVSTKSAPFGAMIAKREYEALDREFFRATKQSLVAIGAASLCYWIGATILQRLGIRYGQRLLDPASLAFLIGASISNHVLTCLAIYLRAHKREPLLLLSVALALLVLGSSYLLARPYGALGMTAASFAITLVVGVGGGTWIFVTRRRAWHAATASEVSGGS